MGSAPRSPTERSTEHTAREVETHAQEKLQQTSKQGKEAIVAILGDGDFFGEGCLAGQRLRMATATTLTDCTLARVEKSQMARMLRQDHSASELFVTHLLSRNVRYEADLVDQLFNSSEKRLARILLLLAHFGKESRSETVFPRISQDNLAQMVGTTRSRVSHFMNKFRKLGLYRLQRQRRIDGSKWPPQRCPARLALGV